MSKHRPFKPFGTIADFSCPALIAFLLLPQSRPLLSQETLSVQVKVVNVLATVRDKHDKIINNLTKDDFTLEEDGRPQTIRYFAKESDLPLTLGLLVDTSLSQRRVLDKERTASHAFLDQMLRESKDKAFIIHFDRETELLQDLTSSRPRLEAALAELQTPDAGYGGGGGRGQPGRGGWRGPGTVLYDAVFLASDELMQKQQGRKALIILSDGVDTGSKESLFSAIEAAQRANTVVYCILFKDDEAYSQHGGFNAGLGGYGVGHRGGYPGGPQNRPSQQAHPDGKKVMEQIARETGARLFEVSHKHSVEDIYNEIAQELRSQYNLGYTPDRGPGPETGLGYHKIALKTKSSEYTVQARDGYYEEQNVASR